MIFTFPQFICKKELITSGARASILERNHCLKGFPLILGRMLLSYNLYLEYLVMIFGTTTSDVSPHTASLQITQDIYLLDPHILKCTSLQLKVLSSTLSNMAQVRDTFPSLHPFRSIGSMRNRSCLGIILSPISSRVPDILWRLNKYL